MADAHWIEKATSKNKGLFGRKAKKAGMSTAAYANKNAGKGGILGKEATLAKTLGRLRGKRKKKKKTY